MTTIAFDGITLAADSQQNGSYIDQLHTQKICQQGSLFIGYCGEVQQAMLVSRWLKDQTKPKPSAADLKDYESIVIKGGKAYQLNDLCEFVPIGKPCAIGSGSDFAMGAMLAGKSATEAVRIAIKLDPHSGGKVRSLKVK